MHDRRPFRALALSALLALAFAGRAVADDGPSPAPAPTPTEPVPAAEPDPKAKSPGPVPIADEAKQAAVDKIVEELRVEASKLRGLAWKREVPADLISREEMRKD